MSTKDYLDSKWPDLHSQPTIEKPITEVNEIDEDIEKQIRQLQEQKFKLEFEDTDTNTEFWCVTLEK